jgi:WD40 repeat protein
VLSGHTDWVRALDFSPDSTSLASGSHDTTIRRWNLETKQEVDRFFSDHLIEQKECVYCLKYHPTEPLIIAGYKDYSIRFWDISTGKQRQRIGVLNGWVRSLSISSDGNRIAASGDDSRIILLERGTDGRNEQFKVVKMAFTNRNKNYWTAFTNSDSHVVSAGTMGASAWSINDDLSGESLCSIDFGTHAMACLPDEVGVVLAGHLGINTISLIDGVNQIYTLSSRAAAVSMDGTLYASILQNTGEDYTLIRIGKKSKKKANLLYSGDGFSNCVDISASGEFVAATTPDLLIRIWQAPDYERETIVRSPFETDADDLYINETGTQLFMRAENGHEMMVLDVTNSKPVAVLQDVKNILNRSPDGRLLAIFRSNFSVTIYDTQRHQPVLTLSSHADEVIGACFSPVEPLMATITIEGAITLWALDTGEMLIQFQAAFSKNIDSASCLTFTNDGRTLVAAGVEITGINYSTELRIWRVP